MVPLPLLEVMSMRAVRVARSLFSSIFITIVAPPLPPDAGLKLHHSPPEAMEAFQLERGLMAVLNSPPSAPITSVVSISRVVS